MKHLLLILFFCVVGCIPAFSQCPNPINVNLSAKVDSVYSSSYATIGPLTTANNCCPANAVNGDRCVKFSVTLNPGAAGIKFEMNPAPAGTNVYRVNCGSTSVPVGSIMCLNGPGPHSITFCNPNAITSLFKITSIPKANAGPDFSISQGCAKKINASGFDSTTVSWQSIPNNPAYNSYLSCLTCMKPTITAGINAPTFVDYKICGTSAYGCGSICDTVRIFFTPALVATVSPPFPTICNTQTPNSTTITANGVGGSGTYTYLWNNINASQTITVPAGFYTVVVSDGTGCTASSIMEVKKFTVPVSSNAGLDKTVCRQIPTSPLNGSVYGAYGGSWSGGNGTFSPNNGALNAMYTPTAAELSAGMVKLILTTTGTGTCAATADTVQINYVDFTGTLSVIPTAISCFGGNNGSAIVNITGGSSPYSYSWNTVPTQTTATATNLGIGTYSVTITNSIGCTSTISTQIAQPAAIALGSTVTPVTCYGGSNGGLTVNATGGTPPYSYLWQPGNQTTSSITGKPAGTYTVTVTDSKNCPFQSTYVIPEPPQISIALTPTTVSCFNGTDGKVSSVVNGGTPPYNFSWGSGATSPTVQGLSAGNATLTVTDNVGCTQTNSVIVPQPAAFTVNTSVINQSCSYLTDGTATAIVAGGTPNYTYVWQPGGLTNQNYTNLSSGTYTVIATDAQGCTATGFATVTSPTPLTINFISQVNVSCFSGNDGFVTASASGGTFPFSYVWASGNTTAASKSNLQAGTYTVTTTDLKGCTATNSTIITQPSALLTIGTFNITDVSCNGGTNGAINITPTGGTPPYTYLWLPSNQTTATANNLIAGTYTVTVKDSKGCLISPSYTVGQPAATVINFNSTPTSCANGSDGSLNPIINGGTAPYTYNWMPGSSTNNTATNLAPSTYTLTITDSKGCISSNTAIVSQPPAMQLTPTISNVVCSGSNSGSISLAVAGGGTPYSFLWTQGNQTTSAINNLSIGTYSVTVTDFKGCQVNANYTVTQLSIIVTMTPIHVNCFGGNNGSVSASAVGGTPNYTYLWAPGGATTNSITNLTAGTYTLSITDSKGCLAQNTVVINQPLAINVTASKTDKTCSNLNNGTATAIPSGGTPGYTYLWQPNLQTTSSISNLATGTYTVIIKDSKGCTSSTNSTVVSIGQPAPLVAGFTSQQNISNCFGDNTGAVSANPSGGTPSYSYLWSPGGSTTSTISSLAAGTYSLTITDNAGCIANNSTIISQPQPIAVTIIKTNETCDYKNDGTTTANVTGGTAPYNFVWQPGNQTTATIANLSAGIYSVLVTDSKGCSTIGNVTISEPQTLKDSVLTKNNVSCFGGNNGNISITAVGGKPNYIYLWTPSGNTSTNINSLIAGTYKIKITDSQGCIAIDSIIISQPPQLIINTSSTNKTCSNLNNGTASAIVNGGTPGYTYLWQPGLQTTSSISNLSAGTYTLNVTDASGCPSVSNITIGQPAALIANFSNQINVSTCYGDNNGSISAAPVGGTPNYSFLWMPGSLTTSSINGLTAGTYSLTVTDNKGCSANNTVIISQPPQLTASTSKINETCDYLNNGSASVSVSGGSPTYSYLWQPGNTTNSGITGLTAGTYSISIIDSKGCAISKNIIITEPNALTININSQTNVSCSGGNNGAISTSVTGGTANYSYLWSPGGATTANKNNLSAGTCSLTVTDSKGCTTSNSITITEPPPLIATTTSTNSTCSSSNNGTATAIPAGGTAPYTYSWAPGLQTTIGRTGLAAGTYTVTVKDAKGCVAIATATITAPPALTATFISQTNVSCNGGNNGAVTVNPSGGTPGYTYLWASGGGINPSRTNLTAGTYSVTITDSKGCFVTKSVKITQPNVLIISATKTYETCNYLNNGSSTLTVYGGTPSYSYFWQPGNKTTNFVNGLAAGTYKARVTDSLGCKDSISILIKEPDSIKIIFSNQNNVSCFGGNDGSIGSTITGGTPNYFYSWMPGNVTTTARNSLTSGTYTLNLSDINGCIVSNTVNITQPSANVSSLVSFTPPTCYNYANGNINVTSTVGGTAPYTYNWAPGNYTAASISNISAGTYTVSTTDSKGCLSSTNITVTQPAPPTITTSTTNSGCNLATGSGTVTVTGGSPPFSYLWSPGAYVSNSVSNLFSGHYDIKITDANNCIHDTLVNIIDDSVPTVTITPSNVPCKGDSTGSATISVTGGSGTFSYLWTPMGGTDTTATGLPKGVYTVKITTSPNGCKTFSSVSITEPTSVSMSVSKTNITCFGGNDGTATATATGGVLPYSYLWQPGSLTSKTVTNLSAGTYTVHVIDANGCNQSQATSSVTISQPTNPTTFVLSSSPALCFGSISGSMSSSNAIGGNGAPYIYNWKPGNLNGQNYYKVAAGTYTMTVTDVKGCKDSNTIVVSQPALLTSTFTNITNVSCYNKDDGSLTVNATGGTGPYSYFWIPNGAASSSINNLAAGKDSVRIIDFNGCITGNSITITQPTQLTFTTSQKNETCNYLNNGTAKASGSGGTPPYNYLWKPIALTSDSISNLSSQTYTISVTDSKGCADSSNVTISEPQLLGITFSNQNDISCFGGSNGTLTSVVSGGTGAYTYSWMPGAYTTNNISGLTSQTYTLTVVDNNTCIAQYSALINQPAAAIYLTLSQTPVSCFGGADGTISSSASGGTPPFEYSWMPGNLNGNSLTNLSAGTYTATATDANNCTYIDSIKVTQNPILSLTTSTTNSTCGQSNGKATVLIAGGISPYSYQWSPVGGTSYQANGLAPGNYTVLITDNKQCSLEDTIQIVDNSAITATVSAITNISCNGLSDGTAIASVISPFGPFTYNWQPSGGTNATATGLSSGTYTVTVTDTNGCVTTAISPEIVQPAPLLTMLQKTNVNCYGDSTGSIIANVLGGTAGYTYLWSTGGITTSNISNLKANTYSVTITDAHNCSQTTSTSISQPVSSLSSSLSQTPTSCYNGADGTVSAIGIGGMAPYTYFWLQENTSAQKVYNLSAGSHSVLITDYNGCTLMDSIAITQPTQLSTLTTSTNSSCGIADGKVNVIANGGIGFYSYDWQPFNGTHSNETNVSAGSYTITVTDANSCSKTDTVTVFNNGGPLVNITSTTNVNCNGGNDGTATASVISAFGPFTYSWLPIGGTNSTAVGLTAGSYTVIVTDTNLCQTQAVLSSDITEPPPLLFDFSASDVSCFGGNNGSLSVNVLGGTSGYTYLWQQSGSTISNISNLAKGFYALTVTDHNGCIKTDSASVNEPSSAVSANLSSTQVICFGDSTGSVFAQANGGTPPYNYFWTPVNLNGQYVANLTIDTYTVAIVDSKGCSTIDSIVVTQPPVLSTSLTSINSKCSLSNGQAKAIVNGGIPPYTFHWLPNGGIDSIANNLIAGTYTVQITDSNSCSITESITVNDSPSPTVTVTNTTNISCIGGSDGTATALASGNSGPFTYLWSPSGETTAVATNLSTGTYTVIATDANLCQSLPATSALITAPTAISVAVTTTAITCFGNSNVNATALASGGTPNYTYTWLPMGNVGNSISNLAANTYTMQVTDANNCIQTYSFTVTQPTPLSSVITSTTNVSCFGGANGTATVNTLGGTPPYSYDWQPMGGNAPTAQGLSAGSFTVTISDFNGCTKSDSVTITEPNQALQATSLQTSVSCFGLSDGTAQVQVTGGTLGYSYQWNPNVSSSSAASNLSAGNYTVLISDTNNCKTNIAIAVPGPVALSGLLVSVNPACSLPNGSITCQLSGGTAPYSYAWSTGQTVPSLTSLNTGFYSVHIVDAHNCLLDLDTTLTIAPDPVVAITSTSDVLCYNGNNGNATATIANGVAPFTINWLPSGGNTLTSNGLTAGSYTISVTDALGCNTSDTTIISEPYALLISIDSVNDVLCNGQNTGAIYLNVTGGTGPNYAYNWTPAAANFATILNLSAATYTVNVSDQNNCSSTISVIVNEPTPITSTIDSITNPVCYGGKGSASVLASGGISPYSYTWLPYGDSSSVSHNLNAGTYTINTMDANGCISSTMAIITQPSQVITTAGPNDTLCLGQMGTVTATATGGAGNYYYAWQPMSAINSGSTPIAPTSDMTYTVVAYDQIGCSGTSSTVSAIVFDLNSTNVHAFATSPICPGQTSVIYVETTGYTGNLTYQWNNGLPNGSGVYVVTPSQPTTYIVTVSNLCSSVTDSATALFNPPPTIALTSDTSALCVPGDIHFFDNSITGNPNDPITIWNWNFGDGTSSNIQNPIHTYTSQNDYQVTLTISTSGGCTANSDSIPMNISAHAYPTAAFSVNATSLHLPLDLLNCTNLSNGASSYVWYFGDGQSSTQTNPQYSFSTIGTYTIVLIATTQFQCKDTAFAEITTNTDAIFPSAFTPNLQGSPGSGYDFNSLTNDVFFPYVSGVVEYDMQIFNRWGEVIFATKDIKVGWDGYFNGKICQQDVYIWKAFIKLNDGRKFDLNGNVTLLH